MGNRHWNTAVNFPGDGSPSIPAAGNAVVNFTNDSAEDIIVTRWALIIKGLGFGGSVSGSEVAKFSHPTAADNTFLQRSMFRFNYEGQSERGKYTNGPVNVAGLFNADGETYLTTPLRIPAKGTLTCTLYNDSPAPVTAQLVMDGPKVGRDEPWPQ